jgi:hypothetical protein
MTMKALKHFVLAALIAALPLAAAAQEPETSGSIELGGLSVDVDGSPDMAAEYYTTESGPVGKLNLTSFGKAGALDLKFKYLAKDQNKGHLNFDIKRAVRSHNTYIMHPHRFGHDPMKNLESTSRNGKVVRHTDFDPDQEYRIDYSVFQDRTELQFPGFRPLTLAVEYRNQQRNGHTQAFTTNHCDNCHTKSQKHRREQKTTDGTLEAAVAWKSGVVRARYTTRELREDTPYVLGTFDNNLHPELQTPVFDNRMQYDDDVGPVPVDLKPEIDKNITRLDFRWASRNGFAVTANGVWSKTENKSTSSVAGFPNNNEAEYSGYVVTAAKRFGKSFRMRWFGKVYQVETNSVYIEPIERVTPAGPHAGQTYYDVYGDRFDSTRNSVLNRDALESALNASYRFGRKSGTLHGYWKYKNIDREYWQVAVGETKTTKNELGLSYRLRPTKGLRFEAQYKYGNVDNAFMFLDGTCSTLVSARYPNPWNPETPQYHDQHATRIADVTASASSYNSAELALGYTFGQSTITGRVVYWDGDNTDGDLTDWSKERTTATVTLWTPGGYGWDWYLGWAYQDLKLDAPACIPVFDG